MVVARKHQEYAERAFDLAYFIHAHEGIALCVAEEAWCKWEPALGKQDKRRFYRPGGRQRQKKPSRGLRTKIGLRDEHVLQCLVYAESDTWERCTERGDSPYPLTEEDMIIRFIKHLVRITVRRNSFYVTLGIGRLLHEYSLSEVEQIYNNVLMQDGTRFKDHPYFRRRKRVLMRDVLDRFHSMIQAVTTPQREARFLTQPTTERLIELVKECLRWFTPWETACVIPAGFDSTKEVPAFSFAGKEPDEEHPVETNRIHAILHPECFARLIEGLSFDSPDKRLAVPQFFYSTGGAPRGDRFNPPKLREEDFLRMERTRQERARRRQVFLARRLRVYVDGVERACFDPRRASQIRLNVEPEADVIEVRGSDAHGELVLATLLVRCEQLAPGESFEDWILLEGGQKVTIRLTPIRDADGEVETVQVTVSYAETQPIRAVVWLAQRAGFGLTEKLGSHGQTSGEIKPNYVWLAKAGAVVTLIVGALVIAWFQFRQQSPPMVSPPRAEQPGMKQQQGAPPTQPSPPSIQPPTPREPASLIARAAWSTDPDAALRAISIERTRSGTPTAKLSPPETTVFVKLPVEDETGRTYSDYRITLVSHGKSIEQQALAAPKLTTAARVHILSVTLLSERLPKSDFSDLRVEGRSKTGWRSIGRLHLSSPGQ